MSWDRRKLCWGVGRFGKDPCQAGRDRLAGLDQAALEGLPSTLQVQRLSLTV